MFARQLAAAHHGNDCCDVVALMAARRHLFDGSDRRRDSYGRGGYGSVSLLPHIWGLPPESYFSTFHQSHTFPLSTRVILLHYAPLVRAIKIKCLLRILPELVDIKVEEHLKMED